jgi:uncharacterized repeat protein (TIGR01451 family)
MGNATGDVTKTFTFDYPGSPAPKSYTARLTALTTSGNKTGDDCIQTITIQKENQPLVTVEKTVSTSGSGPSSNHIKANPGQTFTFHFTVKNIGDATATNYSLPPDNITDVLEYADIANLNGALVTKKEGDANTYLNWKSVTVKAHQTLSKTVSFKMKSDLPKTNTPASNSQSFDCRIQNSIGSSSVTVDIDQANCITKVIEQTTGKLPNTGPGSTMIFGFAITVVVSYFFYRSRLLAKELDIVRLDYAAEGGA